MNYIKIGTREQIGMKSLGFIKTVRLWINKTKI